MAISYLKIQTFRNHKEKELFFNRDLTVIFGDNGSGKTSILEAIHLLSLGKSFKTNKKKELIKKGEKELVLNGLFENNEIKTKVSTSININNQQQIKINGKKIFNRKNLIGKNSVVVLSPEEQKITKGAPKERRLFFDKLFSITSKKYINSIQKYNKVLKQRNAVLKSKDKNINKILDLWDTPLIEKGVEVWNQKNKNIKTFQNILKKTALKYDKNIKIVLKYKQKPIEKIEYQNKIKENRKKDIILKRTSFGPHCDDFIFYWNNKPIRSFGSQGEHKIFLVILKFTELIYIKETTREQPTLLLDDLFATIDLKRGKKIISTLKKIANNQKKQIQTIITTTDLHSLDKIGFNIKNFKKQTHELRR